MYSYKEILKHRPYWMAFAILWIVMYHSDFHFPIGINLIPALGYGGVDIFFLYSGIGAWYTVKRFDYKYIKYVVHSLKKILPIYYVMLIPWGIFVYYTEGLSIQEILGNITCAGCLLGMKHQFNWYMTAIVCFYLIAPIFVRLADKVESPLLQVGVILLLAFCGIPFFKKNALMMVSRLPVAYLGIIIAKKETTGGINEKMVNILTVLSIILFAGIVFLMLVRNQILWDYGLWWYPMIIVAPTVCLLISKMIMVYGEKIPKVLSFLKKIGRMTFAIYLAHVTEFYIVKYFISTNIIWDRNIIWIVAFLILPFISYGVYYLSLTTKALENI